MAFKLAFGTSLALLLALSLALESLAGGPSKPGWPVPPGHCTPAALLSLFDDRGPGGGGGGGGGGGEWPAPPPGYGGGSGRPVQILVALHGNRIDACQPFGVTAWVADECGAVVAGFEGPAVLRDTMGTLSVTEGLWFRAGRLVLHDVVLPRALGRDQLVVESREFRGLSPVFDVMPGTALPVAIEFSGLGTVVNTCTVTEIVATARDVCGNRVMSFQSPAQWSDDSGSMHLVTPAPFVNGQARAAVRIDRDFSFDRLSVTTAGGRLSVVSAPFPVQGHGPLDHLAFDPLPNWFKAWHPAKVTAQALDACGNVVESFEEDGAWEDECDGMRVKSGSRFVRGRAEVRVVFKKTRKADRITVRAGGKSAVSPEFDVGLW